MPNPIRPILEPEFEELWASETAGQAIATHKRAKEIARLAFYAAARIVHDRWDYTAHQDLQESLWRKLDREIDMHRLQRINGA